MLISLYVNKQLVVCILHLTFVGVLMTLRSTFKLSFVDVDSSFVCLIFSVFSACLLEMHCLKVKPLFLFHFNMPFINSGLGFYNFYKHFINSKLIHYW